MTESLRPSLSSLSYDVVVATRNRPDVLPLSLPLFLDQDPSPQRMIVVDSSDDVAAVPAALDSLRPEQRRSMTLIQTGPGLPMQRNVGLRETSADIVMFPDDDALWFPGAAAGVLKVYEEDRDGRIGCVGMAESRTPPPEASHVVGADQRTLSERMIYRFGPWRAKMEAWLYARPFDVLGRELTQQRLSEWPGWSLPDGCSLAPFIHGFRMTFRGEAIRRVGFDETLSGYALNEDMNVCFDILRSHVCVNASNALTYHHRAPGHRAEAAHTGAMLVLNMAYITCRHTEPGHPARLALPRYLNMRAKQYRYRAGDAFGKARLESIQRSLKWLERFLVEVPDATADLYCKAVSDVTCKAAHANREEVHAR